MQGRVRSKVFAAVVESQVTFTAAVNELITNGQQQTEALITAVREPEGQQQMTEQTAAQMADLIATVWEGQQQTALIYF